MVFKDHWAFVTGPTGLTVLDIAIPAAPAIVAVHPLPHFENEDVDLCGNTLLITNDRAEAGPRFRPVRVRHLGALEARARLGHARRSDRQRPRRGPYRQLRQRGLLADVARRRRPRRGLRHVEPCRAALAREVRVRGLQVGQLPRSRTTRSATRRACSGPSAEAAPPATSSRRIRWRPGSCPPRVPPAVNPSPYNDFILHNSKRNGNTLLITEEDYIDTDEVAAGWLPRPGQVRDVVDRDAASAGSRRWTRG